MIESWFFAEVGDATALEDDDDDEELAGVELPPLPEVDEGGGGA